MTRSATRCCVTGFTDGIGDDREFVTADASDGVFEAKTALETARDRRQQLVTDEMAERVIDDLEAVEVEEQNSEAVVGDAVEPDAPVVRAGLRIARGWAAP
jgi:hypothetical protein